MIFLFGWFVKILGEKRVKKKKKKKRKGGGGGGGGDCAPEKIC